LPHLWYSVHEDSWLLQHLPWVFVRTSTNFALKKKNRKNSLHYRSPGKNRKQLAFKTFISHLKFSSLYFISDPCFFFSGSADLLYVEPKNSNYTIVFYINLTFHFQELLHFIIIQDNRKVPHISLFECKLVTLTWSLITQEAYASFLHLHVSAELFKDVHNNCFYVSLLRKQIYMPCHGSSMCAKYQSEQW